MNYEDKHKFINVIKSDIIIYLLFFVLKNIKSMLLLIAIIIFITIY